MKISSAEIDFSSESSKTHESITDSSLGSYEKMDMFTKVSLWICYNYLFFSSVSVVYKNEFPLETFLTGTYGTRPNSCTMKSIAQNKKEQDKLSYRITTYLRIRKCRLRYEFPLERLA